MLLLAPEPSSGFGFAGACAILELVFFFIDLRLARNVIEFGFMTPTAVELWCGDLQNVIVATDKSICFF